MPDNNEDYSKTNLIVFTLQCESGLKKRFDDTHDAIVKHAEENGLTKPKKQEFLNKIFRTILPGYDPADFFK